MSSDPRWLLMKEIYFAALPLAGPEREAYLREHCPDDAMVREVERLLNESTESATLLDTLDELVPLGATTTISPGRVLPPGTKLGHYTISQQLGAGGMGHVYEATDEKLRRTVAIKILPPGRADDELRRRLTREAQSASALNHPNIVTVYEVGRAGDTDFIAMERVYGHTLRHLLREKGLGIRVALDYATQIADALAAAHEAGIVHRDLKPGNIMITERGLIKVLDFGIAKQAVRLEDTVTAEESSISRPGEVIGTLSYMSPEQARGKAVDARSDIFSFGSLVFEMLTGRRAFLEQTALATIEAVVSLEPPPLRDLVSNIPRGLERVVNKCHEKKPLDRWQHISDVKLILQDLTRDLDLPPEHGPAPEERRFSRVIVAAGIVAGALALWASYQLFKRRAPEAEPILRMVSADAGLNTTPAISRDGRLLAFASDRAAGDNLDIWLQQIGGRDAIRLTADPADESDPAFSPDGTRVAFRSEKDGGGIYVVPALGGDPVLLAHGGRNPQFSPDGALVAYWTGREESSVDGSSHIFVVDAGGGSPRPVHPAMSYAQTPIWSPSGDALLVYGARTKESNRAEWWILPLNGAEPIQLPMREALQQNARFALPRANDWIDRNNPRVVFSRESGDVVNLWEIDVTSSGKVGAAPRRISSGPGRHLYPSITATAERQRLVFADETLNLDIWVLPLDANRGAVTGNLIRMTDHVTPDWAPTLSAAGDRIAYISGRYGTYSIHSRGFDSVKERTHISDSQRFVNARMTADFGQIYFSNAQFDLLSIPTAGGTAEKICERCGTVIDVSADGEYVFYEPKAGEDLLVYDRGKRETIKLVLRPDEKYLLSGAQLSRDGKWVVFTASNAVARTTELYVIPFQTTGPVPRSDWISIAGTPVLGRDPDWSPDGSVIYFNYEHDGFRCLGGRRVDPLTKKPAGDIFALRHFHTARQSLRTVNSRRLLRSLSVTENKMAFTLAEATGNIWLEEKTNGK